MYVLTLISGSTQRALDDSFLRRVSALLPRPGEIRWLAAGVAADIQFGLAAEEAAALRTDVEEALADLPVDAVLQPAAGRRKKLLVADMDSTIIGQECIDELADYAGLKTKVAAITERAMRGDLEFAPALRQRAALLEGLPASVIERVIAERIRPNPGAATVVATMRAGGAHTLLVTGGFTAFAEPIAKMLGFDSFRANVLLSENGRFSGKVAEPILGREGKLRALSAAATRLGIGRRETLAVGDGANDVDMVMGAGLGVAWHAKPALDKAAAARIDHCDLTALLYAQGYTRDEFALPAA